MKKLRMFLTSILTFVILVSPVIAASSDDDVEDITPILLGDLNDNTVNKNDTNNLGYITSNNFVCYSCGVYYKKATGNTLTVSGANITASGIGVYFKNGNSWETGSFPGAYETTKGSYPLSSLFVAGYIGDDYDPDNYIAASNVIDNLLLSYDSTNKVLTKTVDNVTITVKPELLSNKNFIKLNYSIQNNSGSSKVVNIATFNDIYIGGTPTAVCDDNAEYKLNTSLPTITNGFNAITSNKHMTVILEENSGLLSNGGGSFKYWAGNRVLAADNGGNGDKPSSIISNLFNDGGIPAKAESYANSEFSYSWSKTIPDDTPVNFSTLIGLGNLEDVDVTIDSLGPNYNSDDKQFKLTTDDEKINIEGTINDKCGMGTYSYKINGVCVEDPEKSENCEEHTYYTDSTYKTKYEVDIPTKLLTDSEDGNKFEVTATSVACGTDTEETTFTLAKDKTDVPKTGINSNYIALGLILIGGIGVFVYSRKHNKFPQV